ncbi:hypothetical protein [Methanofollis fontis]|uniref:Uncharacterized protein n=1 Tax=Methanofollis fontis TaxID=2052832 RepID=A0A483CXW8_9EURY|nr:hypothetical protein [Methanofollis fontis]TAJ44233.1 hypothetical protein CUJ86_09435 [Methanofollis fontis]
MPVTAGPLLIGGACLLAGVAIWVFTGSIAVGGLLALVGGVLVLIGLAPSEYDEEEQFETEEEILNIYDE